MSETRGHHPWQTHPDSDTPDPGPAPPAGQDPPEAFPAAQAPVVWDDVVERLEALNQPHAPRTVPVRALGGVGVAVLLLGGWHFLRPAGSGEWTTHPTSVESALASGGLQGGAPELAYFSDPGISPAPAAREPPAGASVPASVTPAATAGEPGSELAEEIEVLQRRVQELQQIQSLQQRIRELERRLASGDRPAAIPPPAAPRASPSRETPPVREAAPAARVAAADSPTPAPPTGADSPSEPPPSTPLASRIPAASAAVSASQPLSLSAPAEAVVSREAGGVTAPRLRNGRTVGRRLTAHYPPALRQQGVGGTVSLRLVVDETGRVVRSQMRESSGHGELDALALREAGALQFAPAQRNGVPVRAVVEFPITLSPGRGP